MESKNDFRETLYTIDKKGNRLWVYPRIVIGRYRKYRTLAAYLLIAFYVTMPWVSVNGSQAVLIDIVNRKFTFFGKIFWSTETYFLAIILGTLAISLFFFTAVFGRIWCGWACPQTVFMEFVFRPIERLIEGEPLARKKLDSELWGRNKVLKKLIKVFVFSVLSWFLASTGLAYFLGRENLISMMISPPGANLPIFLLTLALMAVLLFQFCWFREQFCTVLCPYARFQSVLLDSDSLIVAYDNSRGEPRGKLNNTTGDCVDCKLCVKVCPTGIDIRNGLQLECIHCASCIDACDSIMKKIGKPSGLIRYSTENILTGIINSKWRWRPIVYGLFLISYIFALSMLLIRRPVAEFQLTRASLDRPYSISTEGRIINHLNLHIMNKANAEQEFLLKLIDAGSIKLISALDVFKLSGVTDKVFPVFIEFSQEPGNDLRQVQLQLTGNQGFSKTQIIDLIGPEK